MLFIIISGQAEFGIYIPRVEIECVQKDRFMHDISGHVEHMVIGISRVEIECVTERKQKTTNIIHYSSLRVLSLSVATGAVADSVEGRPMWACVRKSQDSKLLTVR